jgi:hypothetical protein
MTYLGALGANQVAQRKCNSAATHFAKPITPNAIVDEYRFAPPVLRVFTGYGGEAGKGTVGVT